MKSKNLLSAQGLINGSEYILKSQTSVRRNGFAMGFEGVREVYGRLNLSGRIE